MPRILIVDDDKFFQTVITNLLARHGYDITVASGGEEALQILQTQTFDLMISDVNMTPMDGITLLQKTRESYADMGVIMLTGHDEIGVAIEAMKKGAFDFLVKPFRLEELFSIVHRSLGYYSASPENKPLQARLDMLEGIVAESASMRKICDIIRRVAPANVTVLLCGEKGSDKELIARVIHYYSTRKDEPFAALDCAALPAPQIESKLFGCAVGIRAAAEKGLFETAHSGTLFLDNIDAMPLDTQSKLLDVIQTEKICKADGSNHARIDLRIVVASSERLELLVERGGFLENLYYRLSALRIDIPPLRDRLEDVPRLVDQILNRNRDSNAGALTLDSQAKEILYNYTWPGDIRELEDAVKHALSLSQVGKYSVGGMITKEMLPEKIVTAFKAGCRSCVVTDRQEQLKGQSFKTFLHSKETELLDRIAKDKKKS